MSTISAKPTGTDVAKKLSKIKEVGEEIKTLSCRSCYGLLSKFEGRWEGTGLVLLALPDGADGTIFRFVTMRTREVMKFKKIRGPVFDRGRLINTEPLKGQEDIDMYGLRYKQKVYDQVTGDMIHVEDGSWMNVPATHVLPCQGRTILRQLTVPHGNAVLAQSTLLTKTKERPVVHELNTRPTGPRVDEPGYLDPILKAVLPEGITQKDILNPNRLLQKVLKKQKIRQTTTISMSTSPAGGIVNSPYVKENADTTSLEATFWITKVRAEDGSSFLQLQYTQTIILEFNGIKWPHVSVGTLVKKKKQKLCL